MMKAWINNQEVEFTEGESILQVAKKAGIFIPTLCAFLPLNHTPGTCRVCLVEIEDKSAPGGTRVVTSCTTPMLEGMRVMTRTRRVRRMQRLQMAWIFADHDQDCASCVRYGNCELQDVAMYVGLKHNTCNGRFTTPRPFDLTQNGLLRDVNKCIRCGRCVEVCRQVQGISALTIDDISTHCGVGIAHAKTWAESPYCVQCGQCTMVCPTGALGEHDQGETAIDWFEDPEIKTVVAFAPAARVTVGDAFGMDPGANTEGQMVTAIKRLGADYVCDINWAADVTIMEEGTEFIERLSSGGQLPMMTSCCSGWVNYVEKHHPEFRQNLSTTRSPQGIFGALAKTWFAREHGLDPEKLRFISIMPCTAKKDEAARPQLSRNGMPDTDLVLTVREFARLLFQHGIRLDRLPSTPFDSPFMSQNTGAGAIFGTTGGVMEAALRTVYRKVNGRELDSVDFIPVRGMEAVKEAKVDLGKFGSVKVAVVHGLRNAEKVLSDIDSGRADYKFLEVMACPGGCIDGGGTIRIKNSYLSRSKARMASIYKIDQHRKLRRSHENPDVIRLYDQYLGEPGSEVAHELLHTVYRNRKKDPPTETITEIWKKVKLG
ncbi:[FeFe] hydrogenase, group A [Mesosutterella sp. OilRF-GAM-744-9]|uniref:[FeFe] hydrogenase, group A n=1 Tax=Mesosutterella porci TaxID=2915351 RepID=A0ABS9MPD4_9BURK|nr:2Fe-2S iron-sulfur cluster binding domain-containing protein [Mesosutterella sp. oilRF-744-WT-GAM-9]MCG5030464.1 [FeFe] hydrogenase, group A [Mesosutterella sp. oilRF-744-WT-GAM-9]